MPATHAVALALQQTTKHAGSRKRVSGMQGIHTMHQLRLGIAWQLAFVIDGASADAHGLCLPGQR